MVVDLPTPGAPVMPTRTALPVAVEQRLGKRGGGAAMIGAFAFDQRDRARQHGAVAGTNVACDPADVGSGRRRRHNVSSASVRLASRPRVRVPIYILLASSAANGDFSPNNPDVVEMQPHPGTVIAAFARGEAQRRLSIPNEETSMNWNQI